MTGAQILGAGLRGGRLVMPYQVTVDRRQMPILMDMLRGTRDE